MSAFGSTLLVSGSEQLLVERAVEARRDEALVERPEAEVRRIAADSLAESILGEVVGGSLFASDVVAIIEDVGATPTGVVDDLLALAANPGDELCVILVHEGGVKGKGLIDKLKRAKIPAVNVAVPRPSELPQFCQAEARALGLRLNRDAAEALIDAIGKDLRSLAAALAQLRDDAGDSALNVSLIQRYFAGRAEVTSFKVADAVLEGNPPRALEQLRWALHTGAAPVLVSSAMAAAFRGMGKYLDASGSRMRKADLAREIGLPPWKLDQYSRLARHWTRGGVEASIQHIAVADAAVKGAATNADFALERMVLQVLGERRR
ncbi:MAG: DNA polymerase III subunit delta [Arachnia sp.]